MIYTDGIFRKPTGIISNISSGNQGGGTPSTVAWENVTGKPRLANELNLTNTALELKDTDSGVLNSIDILSTQEVKDLLNTL